MPVGHTSYPGVTDTVFRRHFLGIACFGFFCAASGWSETAPAVSSPTIRSVDFLGNAVLTDADLLKRIPSLPGKPFVKDEVSFSREAIRSAYEDKGFLDVRVSTGVSFLSEKEVDVRFSITEGTTYFIHRVKVVGNRHISHFIIQRALRIAPGDTFSPARIYEANQELFVTNYFETIDIQYSSATPHQMDIQIQVKERPTQYFKGGVGYGAQTKERVSGGYEHLNFFGNQRRLDLQVTHYGFLTNPQKYQTTIFEANLTQPYIFNTLLEGRTGISRELRRREAYDSTTTAWRSSITRRFGRDITTELRYRFQGTRAFDVSPDAAAETASFTNISAIGPYMAYDNTDDNFLPSQGWRIISFVEKGMTWGVGQLRFHKWEARAGRFETVFDKWTLFGGMQYGFLRPDNRRDTIPIFERYTFGGANSVRGYEEQDLGPKDSKGAPLGGEAFAAVNLEVRYPLYKRLFGVLFLDGGQLWSRDPGESWPHIRVQKLDSLAYGTGTGIRIHTPIGALRFEIGYKLNPPPDTSNAFWKRTALHFTLGEVF